MPALVAGIHVLNIGQGKDVDGRNKSAHDAAKSACAAAPSRLFPGYAPFV